MEQPWRIELFGWLRAVQDDRVVSRFRTRKAGALLAYLAYHSHRSHPREQLIERLWPDCGSSSGRANLRAELTSLRHQLEPPGIPPGAVILAHRDTIQLNPTACVTDVALFESALAAAERAASAAERIELLVAAAELHRGELLPGSFEEWVLPERQRLAEGHLQALHELAVLLEASGDHSRALQWARRGVAADPLCEESHHALIRLLVAAGQFEAARSQYEQGEELLERELGTTLSPDIHALVKDLPIAKDRPSPVRTKEPTERRHGSNLEPRAASSCPRHDPSPGDGADPALDAPPAAPRPSHSLPLRFTRFFGREAEIAAVVEMLSGIHHGDTETRRRTTGEESGIEQPTQPTPLPEAVFSVPSVSPCLRGESDRPPVPALRLLTLTGPGGTGKTRLALQVAERLRAAFPGGVWFVPLQELTDPQLIPDQVLISLRLPRSPEREAFEQVVTFLSRAPALLVLDNFEHLVEGGAEIVQRLRKQVEHLTVLVTSRRRLGLEGEREIPVGPLPVPGQRDEGKGMRDEGGATKVGTSTAGSSSLIPHPFSLVRFPSVALFVDRAQAVRPDFQVTARNAAVVAGLCRRLEGLPLAIELAAARAGVLTPQQMLARLSERFELLVSRQRAVDPRHHSLRATLDWSYHLLSPELQQFFASLSVFRGGWTLEAAEAVCEAGGATDEGARSPAPRVPGGPGPGNALDCLEQLRQCSLVLSAETVRSCEGGAAAGTDAAGDAPPPNPDMHFRLLETLREYGAEQLTAQQQAELAARHAAYYQGLTEAVTSWAEWLDRMEREHDNLRAALAWCQSNETGAEMGLRLATSMAWFWDPRGYWAEGRQWIEAALAHPGAQARTIERGAALYSAGCLIAYCIGDYASARPLLEESLAIAEALGHQSLLIGSLIDLANLASHRAELDTAQVFTERALVLSRETGDQCAIAAGLSSMAGIARRRGEREKERRFLDESLAIYRELGGNLDMSVCLERMDLALAEGDQSTAQSLGREALAQARGLGYRSAVAKLLHALGTVELRQGDHAGARTLLRESLSLFSALGEQHCIPASLERLADLAAGLGEPTRAACLWASAAGLREALGSAPPALPSGCAEYESQVAAARREAGEEAFAASWAAGRAMKLEQAIAYALLEPPENRDTQWCPIYLTPPSPGPANTAAGPAEVDSPDPDKTLPQ